MTRVLIVNGSLRAKSHTKRIAGLAAAAIEKFGGEPRMLDLGETQLPMMNPDAGETDAQRHATELVTWAEAYLLGSPDYHGGMSGAMKNFLDYYWHEFSGKLFGYVVASHEKGLTVQDSMRTAVRQCYGWSLPFGVGFNGDADFDKSGKLVNAQLADRVDMLARDLVVYGRTIHDRFLKDLAANPREPGMAKTFSH